MAGKTAEYATYAAYSLAEGGTLLDAYDNMGGLTINIANLGAILDLAGSVIARGNNDGQSIFGGGSILQKLSGIGLLEVNFGRDGISTAIGMGGIDVGGTLYEQVKRGIDYAGLKSKQDTAEGRIAYGLYVNGDWTQENTAMRIVNGKDELKFVEKGGLGSEWRYGHTVQNDNGRTITIADMGYADNVAALGHEAYRDGLTPDENYLETRGSVMAHTELAARMRDAGYSFNREGVIGLDLAMYDYARSVGDMSLMDAYADAFYKSEQDYFDFTVDPIGDLVNFLSQNDTGFKYANLLNNAAKNDPSAQAVLDNIAENVGKEMARQGAEAGVTVADTVSTYANRVSIGATFIWALPVAAVTGKIVTIADFSGLAFSLMAGNEEKKNKFTKSVILDLIFMGAPKVIQDYPVWNNEVNRYFGSTIGISIPTWVGKIIDLIPPVAGEIIPPLFERKK